MGKETKISWTSTVYPDGTVTPGASWNPWMGCTKVTTECLNCYAERDMLRYGKDPHKIVQTSPATFYAPQRWTESKRIFVCSWSDFFHEDVDPRVRDEAWEVIRSCPQHTFIILTKRPQNIHAMLPAYWGNGWLNVWFLVSVGTSESMRRFWPTLQAMPVVVRGISMEPLLEDIIWCSVWDSKPDWVIVAGESGPHRRQMDPAWARHIRDDCAEWGIPFFYKGTVGNVHTLENEMLDGKVYHEFPRGAQR